MTRDLLQLADWLQQLGVNAVAMESTGVYWKPVYNVLEASGFDELLVVNAQHIKKVPGRKTDVSDAEWIAQLLRHGLVKGSLIPDRAQRELRELLQYRKSMVQTRSAEVNRIQKVLEGANIKLASVVSDVAGMSARQMLQAIVEGVTDPKILAKMARGRMRGKAPKLEDALQGVVGPHQRDVLRALLKHICFLEQQIEDLSAEVENRLVPFTDKMEKLRTIPGVGQRGAEVMMATFGTKIDRFPTHRHLASWAGMCPGQNESAGKRKSGTTRRGNQMLRTALVDAAWGASRTKNCYLASLYRHVAARRGAKRAAIAVGHSILVSAFHILKRDQAYADLGSNYIDERDAAKTAKRLVRRLEKLGLSVQLKIREGAVA